MSFHWELSILGIHRNEDSDQFILVLGLDNLSFDKRRQLLNHLTHKVWKRELEVWRCSIVKGTGKEHDMSLRYLLGVSAEQKSLMIQ